MFFKYKLSKDNNNMFFNDKKEKIGFLINQSEDASDQQLKE
jgi:hypothetical protein